MTVRNFLDELNDVQQQPVVNFKGPAMVIAGAGSGKTRVLTYRVAYMLQQGIDPFNILALTFTNKAAREMKERILNIVGSTEAKSVWMGTFHAIFARVLRIDGHHLGYPSNYTIYDTDDSKSLIRSIVKELSLDPKSYPPGHVLGRISAAKSNLISAQEYNTNQELTNHDKLANKPFIGNIYTIYTARCKKAFAMDFDDLLFNMNLLLRDFPDVLLKYQEKFKYILVDEYQDTNYAQYLIVKKLAARHENICVVGDDAQSIYAFRGANIQNILNFKKDYPDLHTYKLEQNYRSTKNIVNAANSVIANNKEQIFKKIWTQNEDGYPIKIFKAASDTEEGNMIANAIFETKMNNQLPNSHFAILYRTNAQSRSVEEALRKINIPYRIYGGLSFYNRKEIRDLLAYFRLVVNPADVEALKRIINYPTRGIGDTTLDRITITADQLGKSIWEVMENIHDVDIKINSGIKAKIESFVTLIRRFMVELKTRNAYELAQDIANASGIVRHLEEDKTPEGVSRIENIEELLNGIKSFSEELPLEMEEEATIRTLDIYLQDISLLTDTDREDDDPDKVALMTIHMAKGLEFPYVFISGLEENLFPSIQSLNSRADLEEERRLFYVAITRAEKQATLSFAESRYQWGNLVFCEPSRFIEEIDPRFIDFPRKAKETPSDKSYKTTEKSFQFRKPAGNDPQRLTKMSDSLRKAPSRQTADPNFQPSSPEEIQPGMHVLHQRFGKGKVQAVEGAGQNRKATVFFKEAGQKQLILKFAKLKIVGDE